MKRDLSLDCSFREPKRTRYFFKNIKDKVVPNKDLDRRYIYRKDMVSVLKIDTLITFGHKFVKDKCKSIFLCSRLSLELFCSL